MTLAVEPFMHPAFLYRGRDEYLAGMVPFILDGLAAGEPVLVAVPGSNLALIEAELGESASSVELADLTEAGRNPGRIIPAVLLAFADAHTGPVRLVGEPVWPGRSELEYPACVVHEALINLAFEGRDATILCPYDAERLDPAALKDAARTHPMLMDVEGTRDSDDYAPEATVEAYNELQPTPALAATLHFDQAGLSDARHFVSDHAVRCGLCMTRAEDLTLAASELCTNSVLHGPGRGTLHVWREDGYVVCEVGDRGQITDPLAGRRAASSGQLGGRGLLLVNHVADLVRIHTGVGGTAVRVYMLG
jgi:anti-sigma regulatory factor (Ser/Thr protein kinase)